MASSPNEDELAIAGRKRRTAIQLRCYAVIQSAILLQFAMLAVQRAVHNTAHHTRCHERLQAADDQMDCFICTDAVNPAKCPKWSIPVWPCSEAGAMLRSFARQ
jgi:hypothetical protein